MAERSGAPAWKELEERLSSMRKVPSRQDPASYIGGGQSSLRYLGLRVPQLRAALKEGFSFSAQDPRGQARVWSSIWNGSDCFEVMAIALAWFDQPKQRGILRAEWPRLRRWSERIDNWAHADALCSLYARILEEDPGAVYPTLQRWNRSRNPWLRRLSLVSLIYYSSQRRRVLPLDKILALVRPQLGFEHHYVQRGVGWVLREAGNVYPVELRRFLAVNGERLSAIAFSAATEKLTVGEKTALKEARKRHREKRA